MKNPLPFLVLGAAALAPSLALAQPGTPGGINPGLLNNAAQRAQQSDILFWYGMLPPTIFAAFGGENGNFNRLDLLKSKGTFYDRNGGYLEIMVPGDPNKNDVEKLQFKLYQGNQGIMVAVNQVVWNQPRAQGTLAFFALAGGGQLMDVTRQVFPFDIKADMKAYQNNAPGNNAPDARDDNAQNAQNNAPGAAPDAPKSAPPLNAYLPRRGTTITTGIPETETAGPVYLWNGNAFVVSDAPDNNDNANGNPDNGNPDNNAPGMPDNNAPDMERN